MPNKKDDKSLFDQVSDIIKDNAAGKVYKYKDPKTGQVFEYDRPGIYENEGRKLIPVR